MTRHTIHVLDRGAHAVYNDAIRSEGGTEVSKELAGGMRSSVSYAVLLSLERMCGSGDAAPDAKKIRLPTGR